MPVQLHQPQAQRGRVTVEHDGRVRADPRALDELLDRLRAYGVVVGVLQVGVDVPQHRAVDVPVVVGGRADVDFDHPDRRVVQVCFQPLPVRERLHENLPLLRLPSGMFYGGALVGTLSTLAKPWRGQDRVQVVASSRSYSARVPGLGETPSWSRRQSLSWA